MSDHSGQQKAASGKGSSPKVLCTPLEGAEHRAMFQIMLGLFKDLNLTASVSHLLHPPIRLIFLSSTFLALLHLCSAATD